MIENRDRSMQIGSGFQSNSVNYPKKKPKKLKSSRSRKTLFSPLLHDTAINF